jgi:hypothetical protein
MADEVIVTTDGRPYKSLITDLGNAKMAQAVLNGTKVNIVEMRLGDGGGAYYMPTTAATSLVREVWSGEIANKAISTLSPNIIAVKVVIPTSVGGFTIREAGLFDDKGDMIAVCNMPEIAKATLPDGISSSLDVVMNILLTNTEAVEIVINPTLDPVSAEDLNNAIAAHNKATDSHPDIRALIEEAVKNASNVIFSATPPDTGPALWFCTDPNWDPDDETTVATAELGDPEDADEAPATAEINGVEYPIPQTEVEENEDGQVVATIQGA